jgi:hypothetical protein
MVTGVSPNGGRVIRRAVVARSRDQGGAQLVMVTLTSQDARTDREMKAALGRFLDWGTKFLGPWFEWNVWVAEDHARGVLHFHLLLAKRVPKALFLRMREMWCDRYGMGPGGCHIRRMRSGKGAAKYLAKYVSKPPSHHVVTLGPDGSLEYRRWRVSRHSGEPYTRDRFWGNAYGMSQVARYGAGRDGADVVAPFGTFERLRTWHGTVRFFESPEEAWAWLHRALSP